jgi:hypothetical protein
MPKEYIYSSNLHNGITLNATKFTQEDLPIPTSNDYEQAVVLNEIAIFVKYIANIIIEEVMLNKKRVSINTLPKNVPIRHNAQGLLDKNNPGPIPEVYMEKILHSLYKIFPDIDIMVLQTRMLIDWA